MNKYYNYAKKTLNEIKTAYSEYLRKPNDETLKEKAMSQLRRIGQKIDETSAKELDCIIKKQLEGIVI